MWEVSSAENGSLARHGGRRHCQQLLTQYTLKDAVLTKHAPHRQKCGEHLPFFLARVASKSSSSCPTALSDRLQRRKNCVASLTEQPKADATYFLKCSGTQALTLHNLGERSNFLYFFSFFTTTFCEALTCLPPSCIFSLTQCSLSEIPSFFLHPGCSNAPGTGTAAGRGKSSTVFSWIWEIQDSKMGMQSTWGCSHPAASLPAPSTPLLCSLRKGSFCFWKYSQQVPQSCLGICKRE